MTIERNTEDDFSFLHKMVRPLFVFGVVASVAILVGLFFVAILLVRKFLL